MITKQQLPWITTGVAIIIFAILMLMQKCSSDKKLDDLADQVARYRDTALTKRVVDGDVATDSKGAELTLEQYQALDAQRYTSFERMLRNNSSQMLATVSLLISRPPVTGNAPVTINADRSMLIDLTDSCSLIGNVTVDSLGKATKNISFRADSLDLVIARDRDKFWKAKQVTATSVIRNNCGQVTGQKAVVVSPGKKKFYDTNLFKGAASIVGFELLRFALTGKL